MRTAARRMANCVQRLKPQLRQRDSVQCKQKGRAAPCKVQARVRATRAPRSCRSQISSTAQPRKKPC
eukprot:3409159-Pleurochrysis_carterae.AAC.1